MAHAWDHICSTRTEIACKIGLGGTDFAVKFGPPPRTEINVTTQLALSPNSRLLAAYRAQAAVVGGTGEEGGQAVDHSDWLIETCAKAKFRISANQGMIYQY